MPPCFTGYRWNRPADSLPHPPVYGFVVCCCTYATTDVVRHTAYRRYDLFTTSVRRKSMTGRTTRTPGRTRATLRWPVSAITHALNTLLNSNYFCFLNSCYTNHIYSEYGCKMCQYDHNANDSSRCENNHSIAMSIIVEHQSASSFLFT